MTGQPHAATTVADRHRRDAGDLVRAWIGPACMVLLGIAGVLGSLSLGIGSGAEPGPGMWPAVISAVIIASGLVMGPQWETESIRLFEARKIGAAVVLMALFIVLFGYIGIFFPTTAVLFLWLKFLAGRGWLQSAIVSVVTAGVFYLVFTLLFGVGS